MFRSLNEHLFIKKALLREVLRENRLFDSALFKRCEKPGAYLHTGGKEGFLSPWPHSHSGRGDEVYTSAAGVLEVREGSGVCRKKLLLSTAHYKQNGLFCRVEELPGKPIFHALEAAIEVSVLFGGFMTAHEGV